jgi:hypothetical protein
MLVNPSSLPVCPGTPIIFLFHFLFILSSPDLLSASTIAYMYYWINTNMYAPTQGLPACGEGGGGINAASRIERGQSWRTPRQAAGDRAGGRSRAARLMAPP